MATSDDKHYQTCPICGGRGIETVYVRPAHLPYEDELRRIDLRCSCCDGVGLIYDKLEAIGDGERYVVHPSEASPHGER